MKDFVLNLSKLSWRVVVLLLFNGILLCSTWESPNQYWRPLVNVGAAMHTLYLRRKTDCLTFYILERLRRSKTQFLSHFLCLKAPNTPQLGKTQWWGNDGGMCRRRLEEARTEWPGYNEWEFAVDSFSHIKEGFAEGHIPLLWPTSLLCLHHMFIGAILPSPLPCIEGFRRHEWEAVIYTCMCVRACMFLYLLDILLAQ